MLSYAVDRELTILKSTKMRLSILYDGLLWRLPQQRLESEAFQSPTFTLYGRFMLLDPKGSPCVIFLTRKTRLMMMILSKVFRLSLIGQILLVRVECMSVCGMSTGGIAVE